MKRVHVLTSAVILGLSLPVVAAQSYHYRHAVPGLTASTDAPSAPVVLKTALKDFGGYRAWADGTLAASCKDYRNPTGAYEYSGDSGDGTYKLSTGGTPFDAYCDMTSDGGGWTKVAQQYESSPVAWDNAVNGNSFSLPSAKLPAHTQVAFGKDNVATFVDYVDWTYSTGPIATIRVTSPKTGFSYDIYRSPSGYFDFADPESQYLPYADQWSNSLTFDKTGGRTMTWTFSPGSLSSAGRGTFLGGANLASSSESHAWTVWVR